MCFYSNPKTVAYLLRQTADLIDDTIINPSDENFRRLSIRMEEIEFEIRGIFLSRTQIDEDALCQQFLTPEGE